MKVAYNSCYGGFGLSPLALTEFAKKQGVTLTWYKQVGYRHNGNEQYKRVEGVTHIPSSDCSYHSLTFDAGSDIEKLPNDGYYYHSFHGDKERTNPDLIEIIERLGDKANGMCADLEIQEVPDGAEFEITEYDGLEDVVPPRMEW